MAGLGRKVFTAGDVLTASDVQNYLMDQSVMVFAGTAARSSAIPTPTEGMTTYRADLDQLESYDGTQWRVTNGMALLSTTTLSGASTTISGISQSYKSLEVWIYGMTNATANGVMRVEPNADATACVLTGTSFSSSSAFRSSSNAQIKFNTESVNRTNANNVARIRIDNYSNTTNYKPLTFNCFYVGVSTFDVAENYGGAITLNTAISSLVISNTGGNWSTGTVEVWGVE
jgi:hypothetical protein